MEQTTIAAIATPLATGSIGVIRISGPQARQVGERVFCPKGKKSLLTAKGYTALYGHVLAEGSVLDEAVALVFAAPKSYTGEDVVELSCHGGVYILRELLRAVLTAGALPAGPGEFTKRAFVNGKLSLTQAEGVMNLIAAKGRFASKAALSAREGALHREVGVLTDAITLMAAHLAAWVDYPEEDLEALETQRMGETLEAGISTLEALLAGYDRGQLLREGIPTAIVGRPNVGKSTLMNLLAGSQRSIVTDLPGTTRDVVESQVLLGEDVVLLLADTAGLRETDDPVEAAGVALARDRLSQSQLVLAVFDGTQPLCEEDEALVEALLGHPVVAILNKSDLAPCEGTINRLRGAFGQAVTLSAKTGEGREQLLTAVKETLSLEGLDASAPMAANERQRDCIRRGAEALTEALDCLKGGMTLDAVSVCVDEALGYLLELDGKRATDAVVDAVFENFCVGK